MDGLSLNENKERGWRVKSKAAVIAILWVLYVTCMGGVWGVIGLIRLGFR